MSRDFTPHELLAYERGIINNGGPSILDTMRSTTVSYNGSEHPYCTQEEITHREQYPLLGKLLNRFEPLYSTLSDIPGGLDLLERKEQELAHYVETGHGEETSPVILWYEGKLDQNFYYSELNETRFLSYLQNEAISLTEPDIYKLAADIDQFAFDTDFYEYADQVEDREQHVLEIEAMIRTGQTDTLFKNLCDVLAEAEYHDDEAITARSLLARLEKITAPAHTQTVSKHGLSEIISDAEQRRTDASQNSPGTERDR